MDQPSASPLDAARPEPPGCGAPQPTPPESPVPLPARLVRDPSRQLLAAELSQALGAPASLVSLETAPLGRVKGLAVSSGRILSFVREAQGQSLRTRDLYTLVQRTARQPRRSSARSRRPLPAAAAPALSPAPGGPS